MQQPVYKVQRLTAKGELVNLIGSKVEDFETGMQRVERNQALGRSEIVLVTLVRPGYLVVRRDRREYGLVLTANAGTDTQHFIAYDYLKNEADWDGDTYLASKTYKTPKGALKKVYQYLNLGGK